MRASSRIFAVTHDAWKLYLGNREYGSLGYDGSNDWNILQDRYLSALLFEYAATLGIIDIAYIHPVGACDDFREMWGADELEFLSRYDGLTHFRLTALGAYILGLTDNYQPAIIASNAVLSVLPSLRINVVRGSLCVEETLLLENWAEAVDSGCWRLDREKALGAIEKGRDIAELQHFLESHDDMPLPEPVDAFIKHCQRNGQALKTSGSAVLIDCIDQPTADLIAGHQETSKLCLRAGTRSLVVRTEHLEKFRTRARLLGFGMPL